MLERGRVIWDGFILLLIRTGKNRLDASANITGRQKKNSRLQFVLQLGDDGQDGFVLSKVPRPRTPFLGPLVASLNPAVRVLMCGLQSSTRMQRWNGGQVQFKLGSSHREKKACGIEHWYFVTAFLEPYVSCCDICDVGAWRLTDEMDQPKMTKTAELPENT